jgi:hypothetical protein
MSSYANLICAVDHRRMIRMVRFVLLLLTLGLAGVLQAQTLTNLALSAPTPGPNDISQLSTQGNKTAPDGINYYTDNNPPVGQTFTTGTNAMRLTSVAIKTAGLNSGGAATPTYYLRIYSISNTTATFLIAFSAPNPGFTDGDWLKWSGLNVPLATNRTYAFTFGRQPSSGGWVAMAVATNKYAGGEIVTAPINGGAVVTGGSHSFDAVFNLGLQPAPTNPPASTPLPLPTYGFNLGNSLEAVWGFTYPTAAPLYSAANAGFNAVRIPVAWNHNATTNISGGVTNYPINPAFMASVKRTVDYALDAGMYAVVNIHWDGGWLDANITTNVDPVVNAKMNSYWTQIATAFAGYDNRLLFAAANEPPVDSPDEMKTMMYYYQTFVNAVRGAGGHNTNRWLVLQSVSDPTWMNALPTDTVTNRIMVEYHNYTPSLFTIIHTDQGWGNAIYFWGPAYHYAGNPSRNATWGQEGDIDAGYQQLTDRYVSKGIPVMIGEFHAAPTSSLTGEEETYNRASVLYWNKYVGESARAHGLSPFYWSTPDSPFDMSSGAVYDAPLVAALTGGAAPPPPNGAPYAPTGLTATGGVGQITLSWTAGSGATSYDLYRSAESGYQSATPVVTGITGTNYTDPGLNSGTTYYYRVAGVNASGQSGFAPEAYASISGVNPDPAQFHFETDPQRWYGGGGIISGATNSTVQKYAGNQSLAVNFSDAAAGNSSVTLNDVPAPAGATLTFRVWLPSGHKISTIEPIVQDYNWGWSQSWYGSFTANAWNTLTVTVPSTATIPLKRLNLKFTTNGGWTNTCYVDSISWNTVAPDFNLAANPTSLTVNGGTNGTSTITVTATNGLNAVYTLSVSNLPSGVSATFTNNPITGGASLLTLTASNSVTSGTTNVTVIATAGLISHTQTIALTLNGTAPSNSPPVLAAITNPTVNAGQIVAFIASATDTNQPAQTLTYALLAGPANATLNTNSGTFSFRPLVTQSDSTNNFTLKVADNGTPSLSATQSFSVFVNPLSLPGISNLSVAGGQFSFNVNGQNGPDYAIETSTNLTQWSNVFITNSPALPFTWTDAATNSPQRFYRIKLGPPLP